MTSLIHPKLFTGTIKWVYLMGIVSHIFINTIMTNVTPTVFCRSNTVTLLQVTIPYWRLVFLGKVSKKLTSNRQQESFSDWTEFAGYIPGHILDLAWPIEHVTVNYPLSWVIGSVKFFPASIILSPLMFVHEVRLTRNIWSQVILVNGELTSKSSIIISFEVNSIP